MADLIIFRCPQTGIDVETLLHKQEHEEAALLCSGRLRGLHAASFA